MTTWREMKDRAAAEIAERPDMWTWVPDRSWMVPPSQEWCRTCGDPAVAERAAAGPRRTRRWNASCEDHLRPYYRLVHGGVECAVRVGSPAHVRGWTS